MVTHRHLHPSMALAPLFFVALVVIASPVFSSNQEVTLVPTSTIEAVSFIDEDTGWIVSNDKDGKGSILATADSGTTWLSQYTGSKKLHAIQCVKDVCIAVGDDGTLLRTVDAGTEWSSIQTREKKPLYNASFYDVKIINVGKGKNKAVAIAVGDKGTIIKTSDSGKTWKKIKSTTAVKLNALTFVNKTKGWAVGDKGTILTTINSGAKWTATTKGTESLLDIHSSDGTNMFIVGSNGLILQSTNKGATWTEQESHTSRALEGVYVNDKKGFVVGDGGVMFFTDDNGSTWEEATDEENTATLHDVHCFGQKLCVASSNDVIFFQFDFEKAVQTSDGGEEGDQDATDDVDVDMDAAETDSTPIPTTQSLPDLVITDVKLKQGEVTYILRNNGNGSVGETKTGFMWATDEGPISPLDTSIKEDPLGAGESSPRTIKTTGKGSNKGFYEFLVTKYADPKHTQLWIEANVVSGIAESDKLNNIAKTAKPPVPSNKKRAM